MDIGEDMFGTIGFGTSTDAEGVPLPWYEICPGEENLWVEIEPFEYDIVRCEDGS